MRMFLTAAVLTVALAACGESKTYPIAAAKVRSTLLSIRPPSVLLGMGAGTSMVTPTGDNDVRWTILTRDSKPLMSLIATITETGEAESSVAVTAEPVKSNAQAAKGMAENPAIVKLYTKAMTEQIAAKLEKREFDMSAIQTEMMAAAIQTIPKIQNEAMKRASEYKQMESDFKDYEADKSRPGQPSNDMAKGY